MTEKMTLFHPVNPEGRKQYDIYFPDYDEETTVDYIKYSLWETYTNRSKLLRGKVKQSKSCIHTKFSQITHQKDISKFSGFKLAQGGESASAGSVHNISRYSTDRQHEEQQLA